MVGMIGSDLTEEGLTLNKEAAEINEYGTHVT